MTGPRPLSGPFEARKHNPTAPAWRKAGGVTLATFPGAGGRVIASTGAGGRARPGGLRFYDTTVPEQPVVAGAAQLQKVGKGLFLEALSWTDPGGTTEHRRLYSVQVVAGAGPSVLAWDLGTAEEPLDPQLPADDAAPTPFNMGVPCLGEFRPDPSWDQALGGVVALADGDRRIVYVLAGSTPADPEEPPEAGAATGALGLLVLEERGSGAQAHFGLLAELNPTGGRVGFLPVEGENCGHWHEPVRLRYDARSRRLLGTWVGHIALWSVREPGRPQLIASRDLVGEPAHHGLALTPSDMRGGPTIGGREYAVIAWLNDGLGVLDVTDAASIRSAPLHHIELPWQTTCLLADPRDPSRRTWFVGQGTAGLLHLLLD